MSRRSPGFRSGFVTLVGRPNVGKSTLLNALLGEKLAIVSEKPQTTRNRILGIRHLPDAQIVFLDTPGIHKPRQKLNQYMVKAALDTYQEVDVVLVLVEATQPPGPGDRYILETLKPVQTPVFLVLNKIDLVPKPHLLPLMDTYRGLYPFQELIPVSARTGENLQDLVDTLLRYLPQGPRYFPEDMITDQPERFLVAEIVREKVFQLTEEEIPYATAVQVEEMAERPEKGLLYIRALILMEHESQKGIIVGKGGARIREIGKRAREEIERLLGTRVYLDLWVKVLPDWRKREDALRSLGYAG